MTRAKYMLGGIMLASVLAASAHAAEKSSTSDQPIEISSDKLDVLQDQHKAIFTGNVIAVQGTSTMRSAVMTVFYTDSSADAAPGAAAKPSSGQSISRIDATGDVVFTTPTETARGEHGIYNVDADTINLTGPVVTLTRGGNILKGTNLTYNMSTGRSVLTSGNGATEVGGTTTTPAGKPARVHGLFMPGSGDKK
ncbi:MAG: LptA/OstA family protein [Rickettsiales bacterium]